jgi:DNA (cytosine-5)-methyltransferase 1
MNYIDLFAGAGGLSEGFLRSGFTPISHVEIDENACDTLRTRISYHYLKAHRRETIYNDYLLGRKKKDELYALIPPEDLMTVINTKIASNTVDTIFSQIDGMLGNRIIDVIIGGPPCQAYSLVGRSRDPHRMRGDNRNYLFRFYAEFLKRYKPRYFVFENVLGLLSAGNARYLNEMLKLFSNFGYSPDMQVLNAESFGVLQKRNRVIIIGRKGKTKFHFPELKKMENNWQIKKDLFFDLPRLTPGQEMSIAKYTKGINEYLKEMEIRNETIYTTQHITRKHNDRDLEIYYLAIDKWLNERQRLKYNDIPARLRTHNNTKDFLDRYKVVDPTGCSHTVVAHIAKDGHYYIYPDLKQVRSISVREAARIQSFPDNYFFEGGRTAAFKQIGNAVPPPMAEKIARAIRQLLLNR